MIALHIAPYIVFDDGGDRVIWDLPERLGHY